MPEKSRPEKIRPEKMPEREPAAVRLPDTYEGARDELIETVRRLEAGGSTLEESLALWERGESLADACQRWLDGARARLEAAGPADPGSIEGE